MIRARQSNDDNPTRLDIVYDHLDTSDDARERLAKAKLALHVNIPVVWMTGRRGPSKAGESSMTIPAVQPKAGFDFTLR